MRIRGFTVIEVLITLALLTAIAGLGMVSTLRPLRSAGISGERDLVVSLLSRARSRAMADDGGMSHGFCYSAADGSYYVFKGAYAEAAQEERGTRSVRVGVSGVPACGSGEEIIFSELSGTTSSVRIDLSEGDASTSIEVNDAGAVLW